MSTQAETLSTLPSAADAAAAIPKARFDLRPLWLLAALPLLALSLIHI